MLTAATNTNCQPHAWRLGNKHTDCITTGTQTTLTAHTSRSFAWSLVWLTQVIIALLLGIWSGAVLTCSFNPLTAFLRTFDTYFVGAFTGEGNAAVLLFTFLLGGTIGLVQRSGGALGLANALKRFMGNTKRRIHSRLLVFAAMSPLPRQPTTTMLLYFSCWLGVCFFR